MITDLSKRGFLPKELKGNPLVEECLLENQIGLETPKGLKHQGTSIGLTNRSTNLSPANPKLLSNSKSTDPGSQMGGIVYSRTNNNT